MKKRNSLLALLLVLAMLVTLVSSALTVSAEEAGGVTEVKSTIDFSVLTVDETPDSAAATMKEAGAVEVSNMYLTACSGTVASPTGGYANGYYVQKLDAGEGRVFLSAPVVDLTYWCTADQDTGFSVKIEGSLDGETYFPFYTETQGFSDAATKHVALHGAEGQRYVYVKITINRHAGPAGGSVVKSVVTGETVAADATTVKSTINFSGMAKDTEKTTAAETMKTGGAVEVNNLMLDQIYEVHATPGGYAGAGYYVQKLEAGEGKVFDGAPVVELNYWLATNTEKQGWIKVEGSLDGVTYYPFLELNQGQGGAYKQVTEGDAVVALNGAEGASVVYVRVTMQHWDAPTGASVSSSVISAAVKDAPAAGGDENPGGETTPSTDAVTSNVDFSKLAGFAGVGFDANADGAPTLAAMQELGLVIPEGSNPWQIQDCYHVFATPTKGYVDAVYIQKLEAGEGKVLAEDISLNIQYWLAAASDGDADYTPGKVVIEISTDGKTWTEAFSDTAGQGKEWEASACTTKPVTLAGTAGASTVYMKVTVQRHGGQTSGGVTKTVMSAPVKAAPSDIPATGDTISVLMALAVVCAAGAVVTTKKRRTR